MILDHDGNVYGTTETGGSGIYGTAFKLTAATGYAKTILYNFLGSRTGDAGFPNGLIFDSSGNLYGTSQAGGPNNSGTIFRLTNEFGTWRETVLYNFTGGKDGSVPFVPMTIDAHGDLYSSTTWGGPAGSFLGGVVFTFIP